MRDVMVSAEITGVVIRVEAELGARVNDGDTLLLMESMKMEIPLVSPVAGRVRTVSVAVGQTVMEGDVCFVVEAEE